MFILALNESLLLRYCYRCIFAGQFLLREDAVGEYTFKNECQINSCLEFVF